MRVGKLMSVAAIMSAVVLLLPGLASARTPSTGSGLTVVDLQMQIQELQAQVQQLQAQLAQVQSNQSQTWCHTFNTDLKLNDKGSEVEALREALNREKQAGRIMSSVGSGGIFDEVLFAAVSEFQAYYTNEILTPAGLIAGTGYVGTRTRAKLNQLYGCEATVPSSPPVTPPALVGPPVTPATITAAPLTLPVVQSPTVFIPPSNVQIGPYFWGGSVSGVSGSGLMAKGLSLAKSLGAGVVRISMGPTSDKDYAGGSCIANFSLAELAARTDFRAFLSDAQFSTVLITAYDGASFGDCNTKNYLNPDFYTSDNTAKIKKEYSDFAKYLAQFSGKKFIILHWEGDNDVYCGNAYGVAKGAATCQSSDRNLAGLAKWLSAREDGIKSSGAANVFGGVEFNIVRALKDGGKKSVLYDVVPAVSADFYSYSSYESINVSPDQLSSDIDTIRNFLSGAGKNANNLLIGEFGFWAGDPGDAANTAVRLDNVVKVIKDKNIPYAIVWALLDNPAGFGLFDANGNITPSGSAIKSEITAVVKYAPYLSINKASFVSGERWTLSLSSSRPDAPVTICGAKEPDAVSSSCTPASTIGYTANTDAQGNWTASGMADASAAGAWNEYISVGGDTSNQIRFTIAPAGTTQQPTVSVSPTSLSFQSTVGEAPPSKTVIVQNIGAMTANWSIVNNYVGAIVGPTSGSLAPGASQTITVTLAAVSAAGTSNGTITVSGNFTSVSVLIANTVSAAPQQQGTVSIFPASLSFSAAQGGASAVPYQQLNTSLSYSPPSSGAVTIQTNITYTSGSGWLTAAPNTGGMINVGSPSYVVVSVIQSALYGMPAGTYQATISFSSPAQVNFSPVTIPITLTVTAPAQQVPTITGVQGYNASTASYTSTVYTNNYLIIYGNNFASTDNTVFVNSLAYTPIYQSPTQINVLLDSRVLGGYVSSVWVSNASGGKSNTWNAYIAASLIVAAPSATFTANNTTYLKVNVGDTINYSWGSDNADTFSSSYIVDSNDGCSPGNIGGGPFSWVASTVNGSLSAQVASCQAGHTYYISYTASKGNQNATAQIEIVVNASGVSQSPSVSQLANSLESMKAILEQMASVLRQMPDYLLR